MKFEPLKPMKSANISDDFPILSIKRSGFETMDNLKPFIISSTTDILLNDELIIKGFKRILKDGDEIKCEKHAEIAITFEDRRKLLGSSLPLEICKKFYTFKHFRVGSNATTFAVQSVRVPSQKFVLKEVKKKPTEEVASEAAIMMKLKHPNIVSLMKVFVIDMKTFILMEFMEDIDLLIYINKSPDRHLTEACAKFCFYQIAQGIKYMHDLNMAHRDIKPENIFVRFINGKPLCKLGDFGLSTNDTGLQEACGTLLYLPPENLVKNSNSRGYSSKRADMWSLGVVLFCMISGHWPFFGKTDSLIRSAISNRDVHFNPRYWENVRMKIVVILLRINF
jgi:serine/threonine protein kinase